MDPLDLLLILWAIVIVPGFFVLLYRVTRNKALFARMTPGFVGGALAFLAAILVRSEKWTLFLAGVGGLSIGVSLLLFREEWAQFDRQVFGSLMSWHRSEANSRMLVLVLGLAACAWGIGASVAALGS